jgi:ATP-GRASP peptide maturase of grasp-with-spasm system
MILIFSRTKEYATDEVSEWINALGGSYIRINESVLYDFKKPYLMTISEEGSSLELKGVLSDHDMSRINIVWFRKWLGVESFLPLVKHTDNKQWAIGLVNHLYSEVNQTGNFLMKMLESKKWLDDPDKVRGLRKMTVLRTASALGMRVPDTIVTNSRETALAFLKENGRIITKPISEIVFFNNEDFEFLAFTREVTAETLQETATYFYPSLFQQLIEKRYDIRIFYLAGECYSMAILSQGDPATEIDFRNYNSRDPARMMTYKLPGEIQGKIKLLMERLGLVSGSIDMVLSKAGKYVFLEVNPVGQFGMTSFPCNYNLEYKMAKYLVDNDQPGQ